MKRALQFALLLCASLALAGCEKPAPEASLDALPTGSWFARITLPGGDIETSIELGKSPAGYTANLINGQERVAIDEVAIVDDELLLRFPAFNNEIRARVVGNRLVGELELVKRHGEIQLMPFVAIPGVKQRDPAAPAADVDMSGRWAVQFNEPDGTIAPAIGEFSQRGSRLFGTFLHPNGDYRYLAGHVRGDKFALSTFDGAHAFLFSGKIVGNKISDANFWSGTQWHQTWSAVRDNEVVLPDAYQRTWLKPGFDRFEFEFPNLQGAPVSINDERFEGKVVVVTLAGTWCPNCHDEARFMAPLYATYRSKGLEVIALMYEHFEDKELAAQQVKEFRKKFNIKYETLLAGISAKTEAADTLPALNTVLAFPTTIFIDRSGRVRKIHTGFSGPATGEHHEALTAEITAFVEELLAEPANLTDALQPGTAPAS